MPDSAATTRKLRDPSDPFGPGDSRHLVQFYEDDEFLADSMARFLAPGLAAGAPALVLATDEHGQACTRRLEATGLDVTGALRSGQLTVLDAREVLERLMVAGRPSAEAFHQLVGETLARGPAGRPPRIFGEVVDLLWKQRNPRAALRLEELWNELSARRPFQLLCGYGLGDFTAEADAEPFEEVCRAHQQVFPTERFARVAEPGDQRREISRLQRRSRALDEALGQSRSLEISLRKALIERQRAQESVRRCHHELKRLLGITGALAKARTPEQVAQVVVAEGVNATGAYAGSLFRCTADGRTLELLRATGYPADALAAHALIPIDSTLPLAQAVINVAPLFLDAPESYAQFPRSATSPRSGALAAVPLVADAAVIGVLGFSYTNPRPFDEDERAFLGALANQCAQALERARLFELEATARRRSEAAGRRTSFLAEIGALLSSPLEPDELMGAVARLAADRIADGCLVHLAPEGEATARPLVAAHADAATAAVLRQNQGLAAWPVIAEVLRDGHAVRANLLFPADGDSEQLSGLGFRWCLCAPLVVRGRTLGAVTLLSADATHPFDDDDLQMADDLGRRAALAVDNARLSRAGAPLRARAPSPPSRVVHRPG